MSLTTTARTTKKVFKAAVIFMVVYILGKYLILPGSREIWLAMFPPKDPPNPIYGLLDPLELIQIKITNTKPPKMSLFTRTGKLPVGLPTKLPVYKYVPKQVSYSAGKRASEHAQILGFSDMWLSTDLKGNVYKWINPTNNAQLEIDIKTNKLQKRIPHAVLYGRLTPGAFNKFGAVEQAKTILQTLGKWDDPLYKTGKQTAEFGTIEVDGIRYTSFQGEAEVTRVDFFRKIDKYPVVGPKYKEGLIQVTVAKPQEELPLFETPQMYYEARQIDTAHNSATYPLIPVSLAWSEIQKGNGVISNVLPSNLSKFDKYDPVEITEIIITKIFLAYYDDGGTQQYIQPIYVFEGNYTGPHDTKGTIALYYPAVDGNYVRNISED